MLRAYPNNRRGLRGGYSDRLLSPIRGREVIGDALRGRVESLRFPVQVEATRAFERMEGVPPSKPPCSDVTELADRRDRRDAVRFG